MTGNIKRRFGDCIRWEGEKYEEEMGERNARALACRNDCRIDDADRGGQGKTYYVDSENGKDTNDGLSEGKAFQTLNKVNDLTLGAGDRVLLKNGSVFEDQALHIKGSGSENAPIKISTYGDEKDGRPQINTNGHGQWELNYGHKLDNQNHKWHGTVSSSILLKDVEYIEIEGLEITNDRDSATDAEKDKNL